MRTIAAAAVMLCLATPALGQEDCTARELKGTWRYFTFSDILEPDFNFNLPHVDGCRVDMSARGTFRSATSRCLNSRIRATLTIGPTCTISGVITQRFDDGGLLECAVSAAVTRDRELISGVQICIEDDLVFPTMFTMIRR